MKFVWFNDVSGRVVPINPDKVSYLLEVRGEDDQTAIVFGAAGGGLHTINVPGALAEIALRLEATAAKAPRAGR